MSMELNKCIVPGEGFHLGNFTISQQLVNSGTMYTIYQGSSPTQYLLNFINFWKNFRTLHQSHQVVFPYLSFALTWSGSGVWDWSFSSRFAYTETGSDYMACFGTVDSTNISTYSGLCTCRIQAFRIGNDGDYVFALDFYKEYDNS